MRIKKISVTNLFGIFNHPIPLNLDERITIIHGPNGFGKTILLRMLNGIFNSRYSEIRNIPFTEFKIEFDDQSYLLVVKNLDDISENKEKTPRLQFYSRNSHKPLSFPLTDLRDTKQISQISRIIDRTIPEISQITPKTWLCFPTQEQLSLEEVIARYSDFLPESLVRETKEPEWFSKLKNSINVRLIEAQHLLNLKDVLSSREYSRRPLKIASVETYSEELAESIQAKLAEYGELAQSLDRTFPARAIKNTKPNHLTEEKLRHELSQIEKKRSQFIELGLLTKDDNPDFQVEKEKIDEATKGILSVYLEDIKHKMSVFQELAQKIEVLQRIVNSRFCYKSMIVNKDKGFTFQTHDGNPLSPTNLSSGEQHELVMLYELLFKAKPNSLILIDEPEFSLHVAWQVQFLKDIQEIAKLVNIDVLIATHSPDIISDRWDLTVELKGPVA